jgi:hypothetical protein
MIEFTSKIPSLCECGCPIQALCMQSSTSSGSTSKGDAGPDLTTPLLDLTLQRCRDLAEFANRAQLVKEQFELKLLPPTPMCSLLLPPQVLQTTLKLRPCGSFLGAGLELLICRRFWGRSTCMSHGADESCSCHRSFWVHCERICRGAMHGIMDGWAKFCCMMIVANAAIV